MSILYVNYFTESVTSLAIICGNYSRFACAKLCLRVACASYARALSSHIIIGAQIAQRKPRTDHTYEKDCTKQGLGRSRKVN